MSDHGRFCLAEGDPEPLEVVTDGSVGDFFLTCEHAGRAIPRCLGDLGVDPTEMERHIAYDIGAEAVSRKLSHAMGAPLYIQRFSRLVIDCNRPLDARDSIPEVSDGTEIPANIGLDTNARRARYEQIHEPYHQAIARALDQSGGSEQRPILLAIHSFTPVMRRSGEVRDCELGLLFHRDGRFARAMLAEVNARYPEIRASLNVPYTVDDMSDYTIPVHGEKRRIPHVLIEIRNDQISTEAGQSRWAEIIADTAQAAAAKMELENNGL
ncbi:N-formylglutamate amidohydrolase [Labrys okinawensis]|uniref:N-formylglutamate amidohydrolase n=1 Tax=Labrys okinawensis TaxID=346911 RepID=UPI0039BD4D07